MANHIIPRKVYFIVFVALLILLGVTVGVSYLDLGPLNPILALTIALGKALLIVLYFMHVRYSSRLTWLFAVAGLLWLGLLISFTLGDYLTRGHFLMVAPTLNNPYDPLNQ